MTTAPDRRPRPIRNAANRASVKISAAARRENSPDAAGGPTGALLDEALIPTQDQNGDQTHWKAWVEIESEPVRSSQYQVVALLCVESQLIAMYAGVFQWIDPGSWCRRCKGCGGGVTRS